MSVAGNNGTELNENDGAPGYEVVPEFPVHGNSRNSRSRNPKYDGVAAELRAGKIVRVPAPGSTGSEGARSSMTIRSALKRRGLALETRWQDGWMYLRATEPQS